MRGNIWNRLHGKHTVFVNESKIVHFGVKFSPNFGQKMKIRETYQDPKCAKNRPKYVAYKRHKSADPQPPDYN